MMERSLTAAERLRYRRHLLLPGFGEEGQARLLAGRVLLVGAGGLGCPAAQYLAAAGVGTLGLVDHDRVDTSNLQRQILFGTADVGKLKVEVARERILFMNPGVDVQLHPCRLSAENALSIFADYDIVVDGSDNFPTRYLVNDACVLLQKPNVHAAVLRYEGQASVFDATQGPCYRCLHPQPAAAGEVPNCAEAGVLGVLPGLLALVQATETIKLLSGLGDPLVGRLLHYDALEMRFVEFSLSKDPVCPACSERPSISALIDYDAFCGASRAEEQSGMVEEVTAEQVHEMRKRGEDLLILDVREPHEHEMARIEGAVLIPLGQLEARVEPDLAGWKSRTVVAHCHFGGRSAQACRMLGALGFERALNLRGGIDAWSQAVDPSVPRY